MNLVEDRGRVLAAVGQRENTRIIQSLSQLGRYVCVGRRFIADNDYNLRFRRIRYLAASFIRFSADPLDAVRPADRDRVTFRRGDLDFTQYCIFNVPNT